MLDPRSCIGSLLALGPLHDLLWLIENDAMPQSISGSSMEDVIEWTFRCISRRLRFLSYDFSINPILIEIIPQLLFKNQLNYSIIFSALWGAF